LQARLAQAYPDEHERILRRLATVYAEREEWEKAHAIYQQLGDAVATADLIEQAGSSMVKSGRLTTLAAWLDALPVDLVRPSLLSWRGIVAVMLGQVERGLSLLNRAATAFRTTDDLHGLALTLERRTVAHRFLGQYQASLSDADEALALSAGDERLRAARAAALRARGLALRWMGQLDEAIEWLEQSLAAYSVLDDAQNVAMLHVELGLASMNADRYGRALAHYEHALAYWQQVNNVIRQATLFNNLGVLYHLQGDYEQAVLLLEQALDCARRSGYTRIEAMALSGMGDLYADLDAAQAARDAYRQAYQIALRLDHRFLLLYLKLAEATLARSSGDLSQARRRLEAAGQLVQESSSGYEQGLWQLESGRVALAEGDVPGAILSLEEAARRFEDGGQQGEGACTYLHLAAACHVAEDGKAALAHLERAFLLAARLESQHRLVVAAQEATALLEAMRRDTTVDQQVARLLRRISHWEQEIPTLRRRLRRQTVTVPFALPRLTIQALGCARVMLGGEEVTDPEWRSRKVVRDLFFLLLAHPEGLSKESIGTIFWPECSPTQLKLRFKNTIYRLRRALGQDIVLFDQDGYRFNQALDYEYDVRTLLRKLAQAQATTAPDEQLAAYQEAVDLYRGPYLPEADGTWAWPERERLQHACEEALLKLARLQLEAGAHEETLHCCHRVLNQNQCQEEAHRLAMRVYAAIGNKAAVADQFERCRQALMREANATPSPQTQLLYESLMR
jgi:DNA-binding SARP family transcriptional activator